MNLELNRTSTNFGMYVYFIVKADFVRNIAAQQQVEAAAAAAAPLISEKPVNQLLEQYASAIQSLKEQLPHVIIIIRTHI